MAQWWERSAATNVYLFILFYIHVGIVSHLTLRENNCLLASFFWTEVFRQIFENFLENWTTEQETVCTFF